mmetsp:Transcript_8685/g.24438  ORF Transcript_8685/g.24438 Transcript_8685/m.24438 type:complete len:697 (-) Transcript_8685:121-2211(-)
MVSDAEALLPGSGGKSKVGDCKDRLNKPCGICLVVSLCSIVLLVAILAIRELTIGPAFHDAAYINQFRPPAAVKAERARREAAEAAGGLLTLKDLPNAQAVGQNIGTGTLFPFFNFVQGFKPPGLWEKVKWDLRAIFGLNDPKWKPPVQGETVGVLTYQDYADEHFGSTFPKETIFQEYYTGGRVPSWEDNTRHKRGVAVLDAGVSAARALGQEPVEQLRDLEPRLAFDNEALAQVAWDGFRYMGPLDVVYASNGMYGIPVVERLMEKYNTSGEVLGILMTDSVFSAHLRRDVQSGLFGIDLSDMEPYTPIKGYAAMGGTASFQEIDGRLQTVKLTYGGQTYTNFDVPQVAEDYRLSKRTGWRYAEGAIIATLLSMTNLVMHVKDLHLEMAAAFQAVSVDAFAGEPKHPVRRLLDPFISRSVQATNDNFKLLFDYHAAEFSLAPLPTDEQLKLIGDFAKRSPLNLAEMDMESYGKVRNIEEYSSSASAMGNSSRWGWRWHYRALTVQRLYDQLVDCWLRANYPEGNELDSGLAQDGVLQAWWRSMIDHLPSLKLATQENPEWASSGTLSASALRHVLRTLFVWLSWIHEDVGHSAAAYVYNPVYTPMCVPEDGVGVPLKSWAFNAAAYRGFVFLHRSTLLDEPPDFWFDGNEETRQCFADLQAALRQLGQSDPAFSECDQNGFYSCVGRVETAVSS